MSDERRFVLDSGSFEDWAEKFWDGCVRPDEQTMKIARYAFLAGAFEMSKKTKTD